LKLLGDKGRIFLANLVNKNEFKTPRNHFRKAKNSSWRKVFRERL